MAALPLAGPFIDRKQMTLQAAARTELGHLGADEAIALAAILRKGFAIILVTVATSCYSCYMETVRVSLKQPGWH